MRKQFDNEKRLTGHDNDALYFRDDRSSCSSSTENIRLGPFIEFNELEKEFPRVSSQVPLSPRGDEDDRSYQFSEAEAERGTWTGKFDFLLSLLGYSVGLGNVWRFPYLCYRNGGGAFLIPFISMMLLAGLPLMFMELSFGQYASLGPIAIFDRFCPLFAGLGYGMVIVSGTVMLYYNMIIAWTIFYMFASWNSKLPWEHCDPEWSTPASSMSQEINPEILSKAVNGEQALDVLDFDSPDSDLWLITRDDPIPLQLNGRWSFDNAGSQVQLVNVGQFAQDIVEQANSDNTGILPVTSQMMHSRSSHIPIINYDRTITSEDRRRSSDRNENIPNQSRGAVLIQLPPTITEGLWIKPHSQNLIQTSEDGRQDLLPQNQNYFNDEISNNNNSDLQTVYLPITEIVSRLPNPEVKLQAELNDPLQQYYQIPFQASAAVTEDSINRSTLRNSQFGNFGPGILIMRDPGNSPTSSINYPKYHVNDNESYIYSTGGWNNNSNGSVLTGEDIELLERLGILSSLIVAQKNRSNEVSYVENLHRESEIKPILTNNGGQGDLIQPNEDRGGNSSVVVLNNVPQFKTGEYHSNIPENSGIHNNAQKLPPYLFLQHQNITNASEESINPQFTYKLIDNQLVEFLHLLGLNTDDFLNQTFVSSRQDFNVSVENDAENNKRNSEFNILKDYKPTDIFNDTIKLGFDKQHGTAATATISISSKLGNESNNSGKRTVNRGNFVQPLATNRRIRPRVLEEPFVKQNEVLQLLSNKAIPQSEENIEMLEKVKTQSQPYIFGFKQQDGNGTHQHRNETSDGKGVVKGSYSYKDPFGIYRKVYYTANEQGFHAVVKTNEPGTVSHSTADAVFMSETPPLAALLKMMDYMKYKSSSNFTEKL